MSFIIYRRPTHVRTANRRHARVFTTSFNAVFVILFAPQNTHVRGTKFSGFFFTRGNRYTGRPRTTLKGSGRNVYVLYSSYRRFSLSRLSHVQRTYYSRVFAYRYAHNIISTCITAGQGSTTCVVPSWSRIRYFIILPCIEQAERNTHTHTHKANDTQ